MLSAKLRAKFIENGKEYYIDHIMKMRYDRNSNTLYITDHRGFIYDFDLNETKVEINN